MFYNLLIPENVESGVCETLYVAPVAWTNPPLQYTRAMTDAPIFKPGKGFLRIQFAPDNNNFAGAAMGDNGLRKLQQTITGFAGGSYDELHETMEWLLNKPLVAMIGDNSFYYSIGNEDRGAYLTTNFGTGTDTEGNKGYNIALGYKSKKIKTYAGDMQVYAPGDTKLFLSFGDVYDAATITTQYKRGYTDNANMIYYVLQNLAETDVIYVAYNDGNGLAGGDVLKGLDMTDADSFVADVNLYLQSVSPTLLLVKSATGYVLQNGGYVGVSLPTGLLTDAENKLLAEGDALLIS